MSRKPNEKTSLLNNKRQPVTDSNVNTSGGFFSNMAGKAAGLFASLRSNRSAYEEVGGVQSSQNQGAEQVKEPSQPSRSGGFGSNGYHG